jgi:predicted branched-subunit amino acid permease
MTTLSPSSGRTGEVRAALRDLVPVLVGLAPFGLLVGVASVRSGVGGGIGVASAALLLGGSAQLTAITLMAAGAAPGAIIAAVAVVNARFLLYGAAIEPRFRDQPGWFRWLAPHFLVDPTYAMSVRRPDLEGRAFRRYWLTAGATMAVAWVAVTGAGVALAPVLGNGSALDVAAPAMFVAMLVPLLASRPGLVAAAVAGTTAAVTAPLPHGLGLLCGIAAGVLAASLVRRSTS